MHLFLTDTTQGPYATLPPDESKHCIRVLRMQLGDELYVTSGDGTMCRARIVDPDPTACQVEITERLPDYGARPFKLHMAVAPTKNNARMEWFVEKAVEIGIDRITPVICDHSERGALKTDRLERIALSAMKQSLQARRPLIDPPIKLHDFLTNLNSHIHTFTHSEIRLPLRRRRPPHPPPTLHPRRRRPRAHRTRRRLQSRRAEPLPHTRLPARHPWQQPPAHRDRRTLRPHSPQLHEWLTRSNHSSNQTIRQSCNP